MRTERDRDPEQACGNAGRASPAEEGTSTDDDAPPGRADTGSTRSEAGPTGIIAASDHPVADDADRG